MLTRTMENSGQLFVPIGSHCPVCSTAVNCFASQGDLQVPCKHQHEKTAHCTAYVPAFRSLPFYFRTTSVYWVQVPLSSFVKTNLQNSLPLNIHTILNSAQATLSSFVQIYLFKSLSAFKRLLKMNSIKLRCTHASTSYIKTSNNTNNNLHLKELFQIFMISESIL